MINQFMTITNVNTLKDRLIFARGLRGISQADLAKRAGCAQGTIGNVESGERKSLRELVAVARALQVSPDWLYDGKGPRPDLPPLNTSSNLAEAESWPFRRVTPAQWRTISADAVDRIESYVEFELDRGSASPVKRARA
ncbi:helix-turn-helix transcriptional regulator [Comamonadaceae bacterium PP-2]